MHSGSYFDPATRSFVVVAPSGGVEAGGPETRRATRVEERAITQSTVDTLQDRIAKRAWSAAAKHYNYASWLDLKTGKLVLKTNAPRRSPRLSKGYAGVIEQQDGDDPRQLQPRADIAPVLGWQLDQERWRVCSSGFVVQKGGQPLPRHRRSLLLRSAQRVTTTDGNLVRRHGHPARAVLRPFDMELIGGKSYGSRSSWAASTARRGKHVSGAGDPVVGFTQYCRSGQTTGEKCGQTVQSVNAQVCTQTGCKSPVISYTGRLSQPGDSGAPFYVYTRRRHSVCTPAACTSRAARRRASPRSGAASRPTSGSRSSPEAGLEPGQARRVVRRRPVAPRRTAPRRSLPSGRRGASV